jgi:hypothetical protein
MASLAATQAVGYSSGDENSSFESAASIDPSAENIQYAAIVPEENLTRCLTACARGGKAFENFCRSIPNPALRALCWGMTHAGEIECRNWCYGIYGR